MICDECGQVLKSLEEEKEHSCFNCSLCGTSDVDVVESKYNQYKICNNDSCTLLIESV